MAGSIRSFGAGSSVIIASDFPRYQQELSVASDEDLQVRKEYWLSSRTAEGLWRKLEDEAMHELVEIEIARRARPA
jgi:hypothetical protein